MATSKKRPASRNPKRKRGTRPMNVTSHASRLASLRWQASDAHDALTIAVGRRDWQGVAKYAAQLQALDREVHRMEKPTMATFVRMAEHAPLDLVARVRAGGMSPGLLARAAEAMGKIHDHDTAVPELLILLKNEDIAVQEGAIYGLSQHLTDDVRRTLQELSSDESVHSLIREIAADSLES